LEAEPVLDDEAPSSEPASIDATFTRELLSAVDGLFPREGVEAVPDDETPDARTEIVVSPLFKDLAVDEMVAVIQGLRLLTFGPRQVILRQGDRGDSLYMLTSGRVRAFVKDPQGKQSPLADLDEGAFFGEMSVLTGRPRTATIVAVTPCELLELDRNTLDGIVAQHPRVLEILKDFARQRAQGR
jgi:CRP-like cAMP-binding protein